MLSECMTLMQRGLLLGTTAPRQPHLYLGAHTTMHQLRLLVLFMALLGLVATSCSSTSGLTAVAIDESITETAEDTAASEDQLPEGDAAAPLPDQAATSGDSASLDGVSLEVSTAEELDRVGLLGVAGDVTADELVVFAMFEGQEVAFAVHEDDAGFHIYAPLNPNDPGSDGQIELQVTDGTQVGPPLALTLTGLPAAPGAGAEFAAKTRAEIETEALAAGMTFEELQSTPIEDVTEELFPIKVMQLLVDDGTEHDLISLMSADESVLSEEELRLTDSMVAKMQLRPAAPAPTAPASPAPPAPAPPAGEGPGFDSSCIANPIAIATAAELSKEMIAGHKATVAISGEVAALDRQASAGFSWGAVVPTVGFVSAGMSIFINVETLRDKIEAGKHPTSVGSLFAVVDTDINADFTEPGTWSEVRVTASSTGYDIRIDIAKILFDAASAPLSAAKLLARGKALRENAARLAEEGIDLASGAARSADAARTIDEGIAKVFLDEGMDRLVSKVAADAAEALLRKFANGSGYCPHFWDVEVTGDPWTSAKSTEGGLDVDSVGLTFNPKRTGITDLKITLNVSLFPVFEQTDPVSESFDITTHETRLELSPQEIEVRSPGDFVDIEIEFSRSSTTKALWDPGNGEFVIGAPETTNEDGRSLITPRSEGLYPFEVTAEFSGTTGLYALANPPERAVDFVTITLAQLLIDPPGATIRINSLLQYTATTRSGDPIDVIWTTTGAGISDNGLFSAGDEPGWYAVTATARSSSQITATVLVEVVDNDCLLVGSWSLRPAPFMAAITAISGSPAEWVYVSGESILTLEEDGTFTSERKALTSQVVFEGQAVQIAIDSTESGTYLDDGATLSINETQSNAVVQMIVPGLGSFESPVAAPNGVSGKGAYTCQDDVLDITIDGITATFDYLGLIFE